MQKNIYYIIGVVLVGVIAVITYVFNAPTNPENKMADNMQNMSAEEHAQMEANAQADANLQNANQNANVGNTTTESKTKDTKNMQKEKYTVTMETNKGTIVLELNSKIAPKTVANFVKLAESGFYNGVKFHRVIKDFMIQAGDPQSKDDKLMAAWGTGGPGYKFEDEIFDQATYQAGYKRGVLAMANSGPNTNGSQFFIMHKDVPLPPSYTIFGHVVKGIETVDTIAAVKTAANDRPADAVVINKISVQ